MSEVERNGGGAATAEDVRDEPTATDEPAGDAPAAAGIELDPSDPLAQSPARQRITYQEDEAGAFTTREDENGEQQRVPLAEVLDDVTLPAVEKMRAENLEELLERVPAADQDGKEAWIRVNLTETEDGQKVIEKNLYYVESNSDNTYTTKIRPAADGQGYERYDPGTEEWIPYQQGLKGEWLDQYEGMVAADATEFKIRDPSGDTPNLIAYERVTFVDGEAVYEPYFEPNEIVELEDEGGSNYLDEPSDAADELIAGPVTAPDFFDPRFSQTLQELLAKTDADAESESTGEQPLAPASIEIPPPETFPPQPPTALQSVHEAIFTPTEPSGGLTVLDRVLPPAEPVITPVEITVLNQNSVLETIATTSTQPEPAAIATTNIPTPEAQTKPVETTTTEIGTKSEPPAPIAIMKLATPEQAPQDNPEPSSNGPAAEIKTVLPEIKAAGEQPQATPQAEAKSKSVEPRASAAKQTTEASPRTEVANQKPAASAQKSEVKQATPPIEKIVQAQEQTEPEPTVATKSIVEQVKPVLATKTQAVKHVTHEQAAKTDAPKTTETTPPAAESVIEQVVQVKAAAIEQVTQEHATISTVDTHAVVQKSTVEQVAKTDTPVRAAEQTAPAQRSIVEQVAHAQAEHEPAPAVETRTEAPEIKQVAKTDTPKIVKEIVAGADHIHESITEIVAQQEPATIVQKSVIEQVTKTNATTEPGVEDIVRETKARTADPAQKPVIKQVVQAQDRSEQSRVNIAATEAPRDVKKANAKTRTKSEPANTREIITPVATEAQIVEPPQISTTHESAAATNVNSEKVSPRAEARTKNEPAVVDAPVVETHITETQSQEQPAETVQKPVIEQATQAPNRTTTSTVDIVKTELHLNEPAQIRAVAAQITTSSQGIDIALTLDEPAAPARRAKQTKPAHATVGATAPARPVAQPRQQAPAEIERPAIENTKPNIKTVPTETATTMQTVEHAIGQSEPLITATFPEPSITTPELADIPVVFTQPATETEAIKPMIKTAPIEKIDAQPVTEPAIPDIAVAFDQPAPANVTLNVPAVPQHQISPAPSIETTRPTQIIRPVIENVPFTVKQIDTKPIMEPIVTDTIVITEAAAPNTGVAISQPAPSEHTPAPAIKAAPVEMMTSPAQFNAEPTMPVTEPMVTDKPQIDTPAPQPSLLDTPFVWPKPAAAPISEIDEIDLSQTVTVSNRPNNTPVKTYENQPFTHAPVSAALSNTAQSDDTDDLTVEFTLDEPGGGRRPPARRRRTVTV